MILQEAWYREAFGSEELERILKDIPKGSEHPEDYLPLAQFLRRHGPEALDPRQHTHYHGILNRLVAEGAQQPEILEALWTLSDSSHPVDTREIPLEILYEPIREQSLKVLERASREGRHPQEAPQDYPDEAWRLALSLGRWPNISLETLERSTPEKVPKVKWVRYLETERDGELVQSEKEDEGLTPVSQVPDRLFELDPDWELRPGDRVMEVLVEDDWSIHRYSRVYFPDLSGITKAQFFKWLSEEAGQHSGYTDEGEE